MVKAEGVGVAIAFPYIACIYDYRRLYFLIRLYILSIPIVGGVGGNMSSNIRNTGVRVGAYWGRFLPGRHRGRSSGIIGPHFLRRHRPGIFKYSFPFNTWRVAKKVASSSLLRGDILERVSTVYLLILLYLFSYLAHDIRIFRTKADIFPVPSYLISAIFVFLAIWPFYFTTENITVVVRYFNPFNFFCATFRVL